MNPCVQSCAFVANDPKYVFWVMDRNRDVAVSMALKNFETPPWREEIFPVSDENIIEFLGGVNAINSCFTEFATDKKFDVEYPRGSGKIWRGAFAMTAAMKRALDDGINILDPKVLYQLTLNDVKHIFRHVSTPIPMIEARLMNLRNVGKVLGYWCGSFTKIFNNANFWLFAKGDGIVERLAVFFESYHDVSYYRRRQINFAKRAQLFPMMYHGRALSSGGKLQPIRDPENFGPIADYQIPKILRHLGILFYEPQLAEAVDAGVVIEKNSSWEIEIRAQTVNAVIKLLETINKIRMTNGLNSITMVELDHAMWSAGRAPELKLIRHHYTYTTAY